MVRSGRERSGMSRRVMIRSGEARWGMVRITGGKNLENCSGMASRVVEGFGTVRRGGEGLVLAGLGRVRSGAVGFVLVR